MIKVLISDLDGTLLNKTKTVDKENIDAIHKWIQNGNHFIAASGRKTTFIESLREMGVEVEGMIGGTGSQICYRDNTFEQLVEFTQEEVNTIIHYLKENNVDFVILSNLDYAYFYSPNGMKPLGNKKFDVDNYTTNETVMPYKFYTFFPSVDASYAFQKQFDKDFDFTTVHAGHKEVEIIPKNCSKWNAILKYLKKYDINPNEVACIGDQENDWEMIKNSSYGIAMNDAPDHVKKDAKLVVNSVHEAIEILLNQ